MSNTEPPSGAKVSPRLSAHIHHALGRAAMSSATQAVALGEELVAFVQSEVEAAFRRGQADRSATSGGTGSSGSVGGRSYPGSGQ